MEANVYFFAALVSTGIFLLQFILSIFFGSMDTVSYTHLTLPTN